MNRRRFLSLLGLGILGGGLVGCSVTRPSHIPQIDTKSFLTRLAYPVENFQSVALKNWECRTWMDQTTTKGRELTKQMISDNIQEFYRKIGELPYGS